LESPPSNALGEDWTAKLIGNLSNELEEVKSETSADDMELPGIGNLLKLENRRLIIQFVCLCIDTFKNIKVDT
jgi:hypothetical protein